jgi:DNA topoisomerase-1
MKPAILLLKTYSTVCPDGSRFQYTATKVKYAGWKDHKIDEDWSFYLDHLTRLEYSKIVANEVCKSISLHWTEAQLIQKLEKCSIGRPSTYTSILGAIQDKHYVSLGKIQGVTLPLRSYEWTVEAEIIPSITQKNIEEKHKLALTPLGKEVAEFCTHHFYDLFEYEYTVKMEEELDHIENGSSEWKEVLRSFINKVDSHLNIEAEKKSYSSVHAGIYHKKPVVIKDGPHGYYMEYNSNSVSLQKFADKHLIEGWIIEQSVPPEGLDKLASFYNAQDNSILLAINEDWSVRKGPYGNYIYHKSPKMSKPKFYKLPDEPTQDLETYIRKKYKII